MNVAFFNVSCEQPFWRKRNAQAGEDHFTDCLAAVAGDIAFDSNIERSSTVLEVPGVVVLQQGETDAVVGCQFIGLAWLTVSIQIGGRGIDPARAGTRHRA